MKGKALILSVLMIISAMPCTSYAIADSAYSACAINGVTGEIVFEKNAHNQHPMASTTKIMTAAVALENSNLDDVITVSEGAAIQEGSSAYIEPGDQIYMRDMLFGLMLNSGNDAAYAIAEHIAGSREGFADIMNWYAWNKMGAMDTQFINPSGLDGEGHYSTAYDMALITKYAMKIPEFRRIVATKTMVAQPINRETPLYFSNHNKLLDEYEGCIGVKTGYTSTTGRCLVSAAERDGMMFIAVTLDDSDDWNSHREMLDYCFRNNSAKKAISKGQVVKCASVDGETYNFVYGDDFQVPVGNDSKLELKVVNHMDNNLARPINKGEKVGWAEIFFGDTLIGTVDIISESEIRDVSNIRLKNSFFGSFLRAFNMWLI